MNLNLQTRPLISPTAFLAKWTETCNQSECSKRLLDAWEHPSNYTTEIFHRPDEAVILSVARKLELEVYSSYYSLDAIFYDPTRHRVHCSPGNQYWVHSVDIAFEHENFFTSSLFQEVSHLTLTRAGLRVLVTYPEDHDEDTEMKKLGKIVADVDWRSENAAFLIILGKRIPNDRKIEWRGFTFQDSDFRLLAP